MVHGFPRAKNVKIFSIGVCQTAIIQILIVQTNPNAKLLAKNGDDSGVAIFDLTNITNKYEKVKRIASSSYVWSMILLSNGNLLTLNSKSEINLLNLLEPDKN
jgi:hypothetical protein